MSTKSYDPHTPMNPLYIIGFLSRSTLDKGNVRCMIKALKKYHKKCTAASILLDKELKACVKMAVQIKKSSAKKK